MNNFKYACCACKHHVHKKYDNLITHDNLSRIISRFNLRAQQLFGKSIAWVPCKKKTSHSSCHSSKNFVNTGIKIFLDGDEKFPTITITRLCMGVWLFAMINFMHFIVGICPTPYIGRKISGLRFNRLALEMSPAAVITISRKMLAYRHFGMSLCLVRRCRKYSTMPPA